MAPPFIDIIEENTQQYQALSSFFFNHPDFPSSCCIYYDPSPPPPPALRVSIVGVFSLCSCNHFRPELNSARSWNGVVRGKRLVANSGGEKISGSDAESDSVSESSGSIVNRRMFERSAPAAPGGGLEGAWLAGQPYQALLLGEEYEEGRVDCGHAWRGKVDTLEQYY